MKAKVLLFLLFTGLSSVSFAQAKSENPGDKLAGLYKEPFDRKKEIRLDGKKYRIYNNYVSFGIGKGYNSAWKDLFVATDLDFNFHIQKAYFQVGGFLQGQNFYTHQQIQLHMGAGYRKETIPYFWAAYGGLSYTNGAYPVMLKTITGADSALIHPSMSEPGVYGAIQLFYKLKFDYGAGITIFGDVNKKQYMVGARIEIFLSGAYRGTILHKDQD